MSTFSTSVRRLQTAALFLLISPLALGAIFTSQTAGNGAAIDTTTAANYARAFDELAASRRVPGFKPPPMFVCSPPCIKCANCGMAWSTAEAAIATASWSGKSPTATATATSTLGLAFPPLARTAEAGEGSVRTTIVRATGAPASGASKIAEVVGEALHLARAGTEKQEDADDSTKDEITSTWYTLPLSGFHPAVIPLIARTNAAHPLTLLAYANTTFFENYIASSLVSELGLKPSIQATSKAPSHLPERDLSTLLGFETYPLGHLSLDLIAGIKDRFAEGTNFTVYDDEALTNKKGGREWRADVHVGLRFLNMIDALKLSSEFSGSAAAGAKEGLGALVQRVWEVEEAKEGKGQAGHDEL